eukprot:2590203-Rhodomonas_salina.1
MSQGRSAKCSTDTRSECDLGNWPRARAKRGLERSAVLTCRRVQLKASSERKDALGDGIRAGYAKWSLEIGCAVRLGLVWPMPYAMWGPDIGSGRCACYV